MRIDSGSRGLKRAVYFVPHPEPARVDPAPSTAAATCQGKVPAPAREGTMPIPSDVEGKLDAAAALAKRERADAEERGKAEKETDRARVKNEGEDRQRAQPAARAIWAWVVGPEASRLRELATTAALPDLDLSPALLPSGEAAITTAPGWWRVALAADEIALRFLRVPNCFGGHRGELRSADEIAEVLPPAVVLRLEADLTSGAVWDFLRGDLGNVGALLRRWQDDEELRLVTALEADRS